MRGNALEDICSASVALVKEHASLFSLESALARQSIFPFVLSLFCASLLLLSAWLSLTALGAYAFYLFTHNILISIASITAIQITALLLALYAAYQYQQRLTFKYTRAHLKNLWGKEDE